MNEPVVHLEELDDRLQHFQNLMAQRVRNILLVASPYDSFLLEEEGGQLDEVILNEFMELNLRHAPGMTRASTGSEAVAEARRTPYDLIISTLHIGDMPWTRLAREIKRDHPDMPVVLLAFDDRELSEIMANYDPEVIEQAFVWHGDFRILLAIVKCLEDRWNVEADVELAGVSVIILIEDSVRYYSSFLPHLYTELVKQSQQVIAEGVNLTHKLMRMRARPKILLCTSYEEAEDYYWKYREVVLGIISDVDFPRGGKSDPHAGMDFARMVREENPDLPIMLQTRDPDYVHQVAEVNAGVVLKDSPFLLRELRQFMLTNFGFGEFLFRLGDGTEVGRAESLRGLEKILHSVPDETIFEHASRHHFSSWLRARTEFRLAEQLRRKRVSDFESVAEMRKYLVESIREFRRERQSGVVAAFQKENFDPQVGFAKIGGGSLGGKARGLAFVRELLYNYRLRNRFPGVRIIVPSAVVLATDVFDQFMDENDLRDFAIREEDDQAIEKAFLQARFPRRVLGELYRFLDIIQYPLSVRSSSLLEDSQFQPFAGIYRTVMVPNNHPHPRVRRRELVRAIKRVYASVFSSRAKSYLKGTSLRLEEEKMAVILQRLGGSAHGSRFYPEVSGVARSHNFYPSPPMQAEDGVASVALGLGKTVVEGGKAYRFCPRYPDRVMDYGTPKDALENAQSSFVALQLDPEESGVTKSSDAHLAHYGLEAAREDNTLTPVASVYSHDNNAIYDGLARPGIPMVTMAPILKHGVFPLAETLRLLLEIGERGMNTPVEIEFAVNLSTKGGRKEFLFLQMRPMVVSRELEELHIGSVAQDDLLCVSNRILGNGRIEGIRDLVVVGCDRDPGQSFDVARGVAKMNAKLINKAPYALIGTGRWGSSEPWLGIPVTWDEIAGVRVIVEAEFQGKKVTPSQGSHFFHNLTASLVAYFTVDSDGDPCGTSGLPSR
jgi:CheY-like chemotaxis protein